MKYIIYARVSPRGGEERETSIPMQIELCKDYIRGQNGEIIKILQDEYFSGKDMNRPGFRELMTELENGTAQWDCVCVYKLSRMTRSLRDGAEIFEKFYKWGKGFISITEKNLDFSTPSGRAMLGILQVFNQFEREQIAENTRNKMISIARNGMWPVGNVPMGYKRVAKGDNKLIIDPRAAAIVRDCFEMYSLDQYSSTDILKKYRDIPRQTLLDMLRKRIYLGQIEYAGEIYPGQHESIIPEDLFAMVQRKLPDKQRMNRPKSQSHAFLLTGLVKCHCGRAMTPVSAKSGDYFYYQCTDLISCRNRVRADKLERAALNYLDGNEKRKITQGILLAAFEELAKEKQLQAETNRPELVITTNALKDANTEREKLFKLLMNKELSNKNIDFFNKKLTAIGEEIDNLESRLEYLNAQTQDFDLFALTNEIVKDMNHISDAIRISPKNPDLLRQMLRFNITNIIEQEKGKFIFNFTFWKSSPFQKEWGE